MQRIFTKTLQRFVNISINGQQINVDPGTTVYDATCKVLPRTERVPTICYHPYVTNDGNCRICLVESKTEFGSTLIPACATDCTEGMEILTDTPEVNENIRNVLKFMLSSHPLDCPTCDVNGECIFQDLLAKYDVAPQDLGVMQSLYLENTLEMLEGDTRVLGNNAIHLDPSKCLKCTLCIRICDEIVDMNILGMKNRGNREYISCFNDSEDFDLVDCVGCGACTFVCPTAAIQLNSDVSRVTEYLKHRSSQDHSVESNEDIVLVAQTAPAVRVTLSEDLLMEPGALTEQQMVQGLKELGFDYVFDTNFTADLTIMEEGTELIGRIGEGGPFPMFTSCCPAWINMVEKKYPHLRENLSSCKSPQQMLGSLIKEYWAEKLDIEKEKVRVVSIMPCTAKKDECVRPQMEGDVDVVLTTRELARLFKLHHVDVASMEGVEYDDPLGEGTGAAVIFGATGGVMEAALRTAYELVTGETLEDINFTGVRGLEGIKEATVQVGDIPVKVAICHEGRNIHKLIKKIEDGEAEYHFVEVMTCKGGCIGGGGNPKLGIDKTVPLQDRMDRIYDLDEKNVIRKSHENPSVTKIYEDFLEEPNSHIAHELLHTKYTDRSQK